MYIFACQHSSKCLTVLSCLLCVHVVPVPEHAVSRGETCLVLVTNHVQKWKIKKNKNLSWFFIVFLVSVLTFCCVYFKNQPFGRQSFSFSQPSSQPVNSFTVKCLLNAGVHEIYLKYKSILKTLIFSSTSSFSFFFFLLSFFVLVFCFFSFAMNM